MLEHVEDSSPDVHVCVDGSAESFLPFTFPSKYINTSSYQNQCYTVPFTNGTIFSTCYERPEQYHAFTNAHHYAGFSMIKQAF